MDCRVLGQLAVRSGASTGCLTAPKPRKVLALLLVGLWSANKLPMDAIPDITGVQVQVNTTVPALAPDEVEKLV